MPFDIRFEYPEMVLYGAAFCLVYLIVYLLIKLRSRSGISLFSLVLKFLVIICLAVALAQPYFENRSESSRAYALVDLSESNDEAVMQELLDRLRQFSDNNVKLTFIPFSGKSSAPLEATQTLYKYRSSKNEFSTLDIGQSNIQQALEASSINEAGSIILLSDGYETQGDARSTMTSLNSKGFRIFPLVPENAQESIREFSISNLYAPLIAASEKSVEIRTSVKNSSSREESGTLEIKHDGKSVYSKHVTIPSGTESVFTTQSDPSKEGIKEITAVLKPDSKEPSPSSQSIYLSGEKREKVLLLSGAAEDQRFLKEALENQSYQVKAFVGSESSAALSSLKDYSAIIFNNIALNQLPKGAAAEIESYVQSGGGFIMIGGNRSFGLGGYMNSTIEDILPVQILPPQTEEKRLTLALQLLLDKSKSMAEGNRIDYAKEAALKALDKLKDEDYFGVLGFDLNPFVVIRLAQVGQIRTEAERRIGLLYPNKGTSLVASLDEARRDLLRVKAGRKHMLVLTDGEITDVPKTYYFELVKQIRLLGITVSTVMLGTEGDQSMLKEMANIGGGAFYVTRDAYSLPDVFIADIKVASGERTMKEQEDYFVRVGDSVKNTSISSFPHLRGYVQTKIKSRADLELVAATTMKEEPLLATWTYGKGKSMAFTSDANGRWSDRWVDWARFQTFWSELIDNLRPEGSGDQEKVKFDLRSYYENGSLNLDVSVFSGEQLGALSADVLLPNGEKRKIAFQSKAAGRYIAALENPQAGKYEVQGRLGSKNLTAVAFNLSGELFGEKKGHGFNLPLLRNLAAGTSGILNPTPADLKKQTYLQVKKTDLTNYFMLAALLIFLFEILWREVFSFKFRLRTT